VTGSHRKGKTLLLAFIAMITHSYYQKVYANFNINIPNFEYLDSLDSRTIKKLIPNSLILFTELHHYIDCRKSLDPAQIDLTQSLQEIGKSGSHFIGDIKLTSMLDKRMRDLFTFSIHAFGSRKMYGQEYKDIFKFGLYHDDLLMFQLNYPEQVFHIYAKDVYGIYDTKEFITGSEIKKEKDLDSKISNWLS